MTFFNIIMRKFLIHIVCFCLCITISTLIMLNIPKKFAEIGVILSIILGVVGNITAKVLSDIFD